MKTFKPLLIVALALLCSTAATAHDFEVNGIYYNITDASNKIVAVTYRGTSSSSYSNEYTGSVVIPTTVKYNNVTYSVTSIGEDAFALCTGLTSIEIPNSVTSIGDYAFYGCSGLTSVTIPTSVTSIGKSAFYGCSGLTSVTIGSGVTSIGGSAFRGCTGLTSVTIPNSVTSIGYDAFYGCIGLTSIEIPNSVTSIGGSAFRGCSGLESIVVENGNSVYDSRNNCNAIIETATNALIAGCKNTVIPNSVTSIGDDAFSDCTDLTSIEIPNSVTSIGGYAFYGCTSLTSITIPNSVTIIGYDAFYGCTGLKKIELNCATIGSRFSGLSSIEEVVIGNSVTSIGERAFQGCDGLTKVTIPNNVTSIGNYAFDGCTSLKELHIEDGEGKLSLGYNDYYNNSAEGLFYDCPLETLYLGRNLSYNEGSYYGYSPFYNIKTLTSVTIGNSVTSIGLFAFFKCSGLESIEIPNSVTSIGHSAFNQTRWYENQPDGVVYAGRVLYKYKGEMPENTRIMIKEGTLYITASAFSGCTGLTSITIPNSVTSFGNYAFDGCTGLKEVHISDLAAWCGFDFEDYGRNPLYYAHNLYLNGELVTDLVIPEGVSEIKNYAFYNCTGLTSIVIPNSVTSIGKSAFDGCSGLTSVTIPNSVTSIGGSAFRGCSGLESIVVENGNSVYDSRNNCNAIIETATNALIAGCKNTVIPNSVTSIGAYAFNKCSGLESITIPNSVTSIGYMAFYYCTGLTSIEIPNSVTSIGNYAFRGCSGLTSIVIPNSVTSIGSDAFRGCSGLKKIELNCATIGSWFSGVSSIEEVVIGNSVTRIGYSAFDGCTGLTSITIPNSVTSIGEYAFLDCTGLTSITIPNSVTSIGEYAFLDCTGLESITVNSKTPPTIQSSTFSGVTATLYVPYGAKATYQAANYWKNIANIEELPGEYSLAVTAAGYASLYLSSAVEIPPGVEVYTATAVEGDLLKMQQVTGILPANTGAIVKADAGTYRFIYSDENPAAIEGNLLKGTEKATTVEAKSNAQYYVLSKVDGVVGMYLAQLTDGGFLNNANKAYLELTLGDLGIYDDEVDSSVNGVQFGAGFRFDFGGTTGVSELKTENGKVKTMYDLQGRKVEKPTNGIYIINGKKILVR